MQPMTRRSALILGGVGVLGVAAGGTGLVLNQNTGAGLGGTAGIAGTAGLVGADLVEPPVLRSSNGMLSTTLESAAGSMHLAGREVRALGYNGGIPGPTLRLRPGDTVEIALQNALSDPTNLHVHGLRVSPNGNGDNPFVMIEPGGRFDYRYELPTDHEPGVYWYHPHHHGFVADQVFGGLYGAIIVEDTEPIPVSRERVLVISDVTLTSSDTVAAAGSMQKRAGREGDLVLVNGQLEPTLTARPGERERWRIVNACVSRYLRLRLDGQQLTLLGIDSGRFREPREVEEVVLAPGNRADLLVTGQAGASVLQTLGYDRQAGGMMGGGGSMTVTLASLTVAGDTVAAVGAIPDQPVPRDMRSAAVTARRELVFAMGGMGGMGGGMTATLNGRAFDPERVDTTVQFGSVEEWLLTNTSTMDHPLHLHVWPMQIVEQRGEAVDAVLWQDVVNVPARGSTRVRIAFDTFSGRTVYHCHILDHEDAGMMGALLAR